MSQTPTLASSDAVLVHLTAIEACLGELDAALASGDAGRIETQSHALQMGLVQSLPVLRQATMTGEGWSAQLQRRLALARTRCLHQHNAVHLATLSLGRTLGVLFPAESATYGVPGQGPSARVGSAYR